MTATRKYCATRLFVFGFICSLGSIVFAQTNQASIKIGESSLIVYSELDDFELGSKPIIDWVENSAKIVADYYGGFPVRNASVVLDTFNGGGVISGRAHGLPVLQVVIEIGQYVTQKQLDRDWILVHELIHLALADIPDKHHWLEEGLPTYIESVSRVQAGDLDEKFVWKGFLKNMPKGLATGNDSGLDNARSLGRTYWGGALFCLLADIEIHKQTNNRFGLREAVQNVVQTGLTMDKATTMERLLNTADQPTGTNVMSDLYAIMKDKPLDINLNALWSDLGVIYNTTSGLIDFNDEAPLASIRKSIMMP